LFFDLILILAEFIYKINRGKQKPLNILAVFVQRNVLAPLVLL